MIIGGGFISLDFASGFRANGIRDVTILVREDYYWQGKLDEKSGQILSDILKKNGIKIKTNEEVDHFDNSNNRSEVITKLGERYEADVIGVGIGIKPDFLWLEGSGIKFDRGVVANEYLQTSVPDIYAAGDCCEFHDIVVEGSHTVGNWSNATSQGKVAGMNMMATPLRSARKSFEGQRKTVFETVSSYSDTFFDNSYSFIGVTDEKVADQVIIRSRWPSGPSGPEGITRIFLKEFNGLTLIIGATIVNSAADSVSLTMAVKNKIDVAKYKDRLADLGFDLKSILS